MRLILSRKGFDSSAGGCPSPVLGQTGSAQGHLRNQGVESGDLFLFFGVFRRAEMHNRRWRFVPGSRPFHAIWGWLHVGQIHTIDELAPGALPWARYHPHFHGQPDAGNTLYESSHACQLPTGAEVFAGSGVFPKLRDELVLTDPQSRLPTRWRLPAAFYPGDDRPPLSYHTKPDRWQFKSPWCYLNCAARGQEFVLDLEAYPDLTDWLSGLLRTGRDGQLRP